MRPAQKHRRNHPLTRGRGDDLKLFSQEEVIELVQVLSTWKDRDHTNHYVENKYAYILCI